MRKLVKNEKIDLLYSIIFVLSMVILGLIIKLLQIDLGCLGNAWVLVLVAFSNFPVVLRRKKQHKKIDALRIALDLSIEEVRAIIDIGRYDLVDWNWKQAFISPRQLYLLEDKLDKKYIHRFGEAFEMP